MRIVNQIFKFWPVNSLVALGTAGLTGIDEWLGDDPWDVIHFNWGLHDLKYMGPNIRAASTLELAFLSRVLGIIFGSIHGALVCEAEGVPVSEFTSILPEGGRAIPLTEAIHAGSFDTISSGGASVDVAGEAVSGLYDHAISVGINSDLPSVMRDWVKRAQAVGYGSQETATVIKILRQPKG